MEISIQNIFQVFSPFSLILFLISFLILCVGLFKYITAEGNPKEKAEGEVLLTVVIPMILFLIALLETIVHLIRIYKHE